MRKRIIITCTAFLIIQNIFLSDIIYNPKHDEKLSSAVFTQAADEKRGDPPYDYIIGKDGWPHFRVFFWVPVSAVHITPYADAGVKTDVSEHSTAEKWNVVETKIVKGKEKLVFVYVPKTFVFLHGKGFERVIHLRY